MRKGAPDRRPALPQLRHAPRGLVITWIRREAQHISPSLAENRTFLSKVLQQSIDFRKRYFNPRAVLPCGLDAVFSLPTFRLGANWLTAKWGGSAGV